MSVSIQNSQVMASPSPDDPTSQDSTPPGISATGDDLDLEAVAEIEAKASPEAGANADAEADADAHNDAETTADAGEATAAASAASGSSGSSGTSGGTAIGIDELAIEKWTAEQQKVFESVKQKVQELGIAQDDVQRIAAFSVLQFIQEKDRKPDTRVDRVQAVNANGDVIVRMENMKYGDREPIFNNDVRLKDAPAFDQSAAQIQQANQGLQNKSAAEQAVAQHRQNEDTNQRERPTVLQQADDQISARLQSSMPALTRGGR
jgi:hypothetical protein